MREGMDRSLAREGFLGRGLIEFARGFGNFDGVYRERTARSLCCSVHEVSRGAI